MELLEAIPDFRWPQCAHETGFAVGLSSLCRYAEEHGNTSPPHNYHDPDGYQPWQFIKACRHRYASGKMSAEEAGLLQALPGWRWTGGARAGTSEQLWAQGFGAVVAFAAAHGHAVVPFDYIDSDGVLVGKWVSHRRADYQQGVLAAERVAALESVEGWIWSPTNQAWTNGFAALTAYAAEHGTSAVPRDYVRADGFRLGNWVSNQRASRRTGRLPEQYARALEALPGWAWAKPARPAAVRYAPTP